MKWKDRVGTSEVFYFLVNCPQGLLSLSFTSFMLDYVCLKKKSKAGSQTQPQNNDVFLLWGVFKDPR